MKTMTDSQLSNLTGGGDSLQKDLGQFVGGMSGWLRANTATYLMLGPGFGAYAAIVAGLKEATL